MPHPEVDPGDDRTERAKETILAFFAGLEQRLERLERKVDFANERIDLIGRMAFGDLRRGPSAIAPITPAAAREAARALAAIRDAFGVFFGRR